MRRIVEEEDGEKKGEEKKTCDGDIFSSCKENEGNRRRKIIKMKWKKQRK